MRAIVLDDQVSVTTGRPAPTPAEGEVLVRVIRAGVCETDLQLIKGYMGFRGVLGHEFVGVAESGPMKGRRVVGEINCACWKCETCRIGLPTHCPNRTVLGILNHDGAFADLIAVPQRNLHVVPDSLSDDVAVFTEPVAAAFQIPVQLTIGEQDRIAVLGDGRLGNLCAQVTRQADRPRSCYRQASRKAGDPRIDGYRHNSSIQFVGGACLRCCRGLHGIRVRAADGVETRTPSRNDRAEDHSGWPADSGVGAIRHRRDHAAGIALRAVRSGACGARAGGRAGEAAHLRSI